MKKATGMDLGATKSVVAVMEGGKPTETTNSDDRRLTHSCDQWLITFRRLSMES